MTITITGATGFIGSKLVQKLMDRGHNLHVLGRKRSDNLPSAVKFWAWDSMRGEPPAESLEGSGAVIHLAGEPVAQRWNSAVKQRIRDSRVNGTGNLVSAISKLSRRPHILVNASAIGIYGSRGDEILTEQSPPGAGFLATVTSDWELAAGRAEPLGLRVVRVRIGVVLGREGGALSEMLPPFRAGLGGKLASGHQWMSWIHVEDLIDLMLFALENPAIRGSVNAVSSNPVRNEEFTKELGATLHRPAILTVPHFVIKLRLGELAGEILSSQRVLPQAAEKAGYRFQHPQLGEALRHLLH
jgi:uncharacterized protein (TIGR01777 family)